MIQLLKIEWLKLKNYTAFKVLLLFFTLGIFISNYVVYLVQKNITAEPGAEMLVGSFNPYSFTSTWQTTSYATGCLLILPAMIMLIIVTNEYTFKTNRQNIIDGWSRKEFISVKLVLAILIALFTTLLVLITAYSFGLASGTPFSSNSFSHVGYFLLKAITYNIFAVLIAVLVKKTGFAIGLFFIYLTAENFLSQFLDIASNKFKASSGHDLGSVGDYLPLNAADGLLTFPDNPLKSIAANTLPTNYTWLVLGLAVGYVILFMLWSRYKYSKADL